MHFLEGEIRHTYLFTIHVHYFDLPEIVGNLNDPELKPSQPEIGVWLCLFCACHGILCACVIFVHGPTLNNTSWCFVGCFSCLV